MERLTTIGWVRFDSFPDYRINACMSQFKETTTRLLLETVNLLGQQLKYKNPLIKRNMI